MKLFITGVTGMVGRNLCNLANKRGYQVIAPTRAELDLTELTNIIAYLQKTKPDVVIHCAGLVSGIKDNMEYPYNFCYQNLLLGMNVIQASYQAGITKLINLGSSCMYPKDAENPIKESQILQGLPIINSEGYGIAKATTAHLTKYITLQNRIEYKTYIPCNLYGYWDSFDDNKSHLIAAIIKKIYNSVEKQQPKVIIWGNGIVRREVLFSEDLADFILFSLQEFSNIPNIINVGSGVDYTINEYYKIIAKILGYQGTFIYDLSEPVGTQQKLLDISKIKKLGWQPKTSLEDGIGKTYKFYVHNIMQSQLKEGLI